MSTAAQRSGGQEEDTERNAHAFSGPAGPLLEDIRVRLFEQGGGRAGLLAVEPRTHAVYERIAEWLAEQAGEGRTPAAASTIPGAGVGAAVPPQRRSPSAERRWQEYLRQTSASIDRRSRMLDERGQPRVVRTFGSGGALWHVDLSDWRGRHRVRLTYDGATGDAMEVRLISGSGHELRYSPESFEKPGSSLRTALERARLSCAQLSGDDLPARAGRLRASRLARQSVEAFCEAALPRLERLLRRELEEGIRLVPSPKELLEMDPEQIMQFLERA